MENQNRPKADANGGEAAPAPAPAPVPAPAPEQKLPDARKRMPIDVLVVLEMLAGKTQASDDRRTAPRCPFVALAKLQLQSETRPRWIYLRDAHQWGAGFITPEQIREGAKGILHVTAQGQDVAVACRLIRCRKVLPEWWEGALQFEIEEPRLSFAAITQPPSG